MLRACSTAAFAVTLFAVAASPPARAADAPSAVETTILHRFKIDPDGVDGQSLAVAPRSAHVAFRAQRKDGWHWYVDGAAGPAFDDVGPLVFSDDGARYAYLGRKQRDWTLVVDGVGKAVETVKLVAERSLRFSPDGKRLAFEGSLIVDGRPVGEVVVVDGVVGTPYRGIEYASIVFSRDGTRVAYPATDGPTSFVVVDGKAGAAYPRGTLGAPAFSADGKHVAYTVQLSGSRFMVLGDAEGGKFDRIGPPVFAPKGGRWVYVGARAGKNLVVTDRVEGKPYDEVAAPVWSDDGAHVAYVAKLDKTVRVVADGKEGAPYVWIGATSLGWSADGKRLAYWANPAKGSKPRYVIDGVEQKEADLVSDSSGAAFSPDGKHVAYAVKRAGMWVVRTDEVDGPELDAIGKGYPVFSPAGRVVYEAVVGKQWHLFTGTDPGPAFDGIVEGTLAFGTDGSSVACVVRRGDEGRVAIDGLEGEAYQAILPGSELTPDGPRSFHAWFVREEEFLHARTARVR